jgi:tRNA threonylcarbamoyladenosine biosynthesis protein TsaB
VVILALDTTTKAGSCALWRDRALVEQRPGDAARTHAERLPADLAELLAAHGLTVKDVDLYAVASGPGSFTGLRVGIATIQGLALVHDRKVVAVSALEALAQCGAAEAPDATLAGGWMEAYRGEVFGALYRIAARGGADAHGLATLEEVAPPAVANPAALAADWARIWQAGGLGASPGTEASANAATASAGVIIGDAVPATRDALSAALPASTRLLDTIPLAATIARLAHAHPERATLPHAIIPLYVRRPDAELARDRRDRGEPRPAVTA